MELQATRNRHLSCNNVNALFVVYRTRENIAYKTSWQEIWSKKYKKHARHTTPAYTAGAKINPVWECRKNNTIGVNGARRSRYINHSSVTMYPQNETAPRMYHAKKKRSDCSSQVHAINILKCGSHMQGLAENSASAGCFVCHTSMYIEIVAPYPTYSMHAINAAPTQIYYTRVVSSARHYELLHACSNFLVTVQFTTRV